MTQNCAVAVSICASCAINLWQWVMKHLNSPSQQWRQTQTIIAALITVGKQTFVWVLCTSTDTLQLNWQEPFNCVHDTWSMVWKPLQRRLAVMIMYWSDCDGWPWRKYKWSSWSSWRAFQTWSSRHRDTMLSVALIYLVAVICSATWTHTLPLYPESNQEPQAGKTLENYFLLFRFRIIFFDSLYPIWRHLLHALNTQTNSSSFLICLVITMIFRIQKRRKKMFYLNRFDPEVNVRSRGRGQCCWRGEERAE